MFLALKQHRGYSRKLLADLALSKLRNLTAKGEARHQRNQSTEDRFWSFFAKVRPKYLRPVHFRTYVLEVLAAVGGERRLVFAAPPQHGKTEVTLALLVFLAIQYPERRWAYVTYNQQRARKIARLVRFLFASAGVVVRGSLSEMYLPGGGQILFASVDGGITGEPIDGACFIDDPYKGRPHADSLARRQLVEDSYRQAIELRVHPGASIFVLATRWHPQDLSGVLIGEGWRYINLPALAEGEVNDNGVVKDDPLGRRVGEALFPELWSVDALNKKRKRVLEFGWVALYQGRPRPRGGKVFHEPTFYTELPRKFRGVFGVDLAYTAKTSSDWSVCVELWRENRPGLEPLFYVVRVDRAQVEAPSFALTLKARHVKRPTWKMYWRASGTEKGAASFLKRAGLPVVVKQPPGDKLVCATPVAAAWNDGRVLMPDPETFPEFYGEDGWGWQTLDVIQNFTGIGDELDDDVDALGNAYEKLSRGLDMMDALEEAGT